MFFNPVSAPSIEHKYYDRGGDAGWDFTEATLTDDNAWHDLDLSAIIPVSTVAVILNTQVTHGAAAGVIRWAITGLTPIYNAYPVRSDGGGLYGDGAPIVGVDGDRKVQYKIAPAGIDSCKVYVAGWFK